MTHPIQKPSSLLSRRKTSFLLCHQSTDFSTSPYPIDASNLQDLSVKIPKKSYTGLGYLLYKLRYILWQDVVPHNTLNQSFFISVDNLATLRQITMSLYATCFTWQIMKLLKSPEDDVSLEASWLCFWGLLLGATYFLLTLIAQDEPDTSFLWKFTYIIGEVSMAIELLILSMNLPGLISQLSGEEYFNSDEVAYKICVTVLCPLLAIAEIVCNYIAFPKCHRTSLCILAVIYLCTEILWIVIRNQSLFEAMNWSELRNYLFKGAFVCVMLLEFMLGNKFFDWKLLRSARSTSKSSKKTA